ncbi:conserved hypothetical protein [Coccidioides posadasii str. Silveira]|uniref:Zn(2)-C6 fungal-type domain-containing protein n=1 Tax=Coccidioides posadasii (strain RMSCC 757 / Silveira) TaxID=443226 RepID=E9CY06_COCPS|nr:conserved hypothetical protein [Coccidioides posadasii str. Silveira]
MDRTSARRRQGTRPLSQPHRFNAAPSSSPNIPSYPATNNSLPLQSDLGNVTITTHFQTEHKVPIPRLQRPGSKQAASGSDRQRVSHACEPCRRRKSKCDGLQPPCGRCRDQEIHCYYEDGKREKLKRNARTMAAKLERYESLLSELLPNQDANRQQDIRNALSERRFAEEDSLSGEDAIEDEHSVLVSTTSPQLQNCAQHNAIVSVGSAGYLGNSSVVHWVEEVMMKLATNKLVSKSHDLTPGALDSLAGMADEPSLNDIESLLVHDCTYFANDITQSQVSGISQSIDAALQLPPKSTAELLIDSYFSTVHPVFPVIAERNFIPQYLSYRETTQPPNGSCLWLAILNVVFAIGALFSERVRMPHEGLDHIVYWIRSRVLGQEPIQMINLPTMEHIQLLTISGMYCIASYQINRASYLIALAVRYAYGQALHLVDNPPNTSDEERELRVKVWHSLCSAERLLSLLTGLPSSIQDRHISTQLSSATDTYYSNPSAAERFASQGSTLTIPMAGSRKGSLSCDFDVFVASLRLDSIVNEALGALYSSSTVNQTWARVQKMVIDLNSKLIHWENDLSPGLLVSPKHDNIAGVPLAQRMYLSLRYLSAKMLINKPGLCDIYKLNAAIPSQSEASRQSDADAALRCLSAARNLVQLLPAHVDAVEFYRATPWWCALHYLIQAGVVLMTEVSFDMQHIPAEKENIIAESALVIRWLEALSITSDSAHRASLSLNRLLKLALEKAGKPAGNTLPFSPDTSIPGASSPQMLPFNTQDPNFLSGTNWGPASPS